MSIRVKTTYLGANRERGTRIRVQWADAALGRMASKSVPYSYASNDPHRTAVETVFPGRTITLGSQHARGDWFDVT